MSDEQPIDTVRRFCAAWGTEDLDTIIGFFTDDAVYHNIPLAPVTGPEQIRATIEGFSGGGILLADGVSKDGPAGDPGFVVPSQGGGGGNGNGNPGPDVCDPTDPNCP